MANRKYLDASGLNYLWQKIKYGFASVGASGFATNNGVLLADGVKGITGSAYTLGASSMGSGATVLATEAGVSGAIAAATTNMVTAPSNFAAANQVLLAGGANKTAKTDGYTIGGTELVGGDKVLATETGVSAAIDSAIGALKIAGVTGNILSIVDKKVNTTLSIAIEKGASGTSDADKDFIVLKGVNGAEVSKVDATAFVKDGMLEAAGFYRKTAEGWEKISGDNITIDVQSGTVGHEYIVLKWNSDGENKITLIDAHTLVDVYIGTTGIYIDSNKNVGIKLDATQGNVSLTTSINGLKANVAVTALTPTAAFGSEVNLGSVAGTTFNFTMPSETHEPMDETEFNSGISGAEYLMSQPGYEGPTWPSAS